MKERSRREARSDSSDQSSSPCLHSISLGYRNSGREKKRKKKREGEGRTRPRLIACRHGLED